MRYDPLTFTIEETDPVAFDIDETESVLFNITDAVIGSGASTWDEITEKPFSTIGSGLTVENDVLKATAYTKTEVDTLLDEKADADDVYTKAETDSAISAHHDSTKADVSTTYTKTEVDSLLDEKADTDDIPTKTSELTNDSGFLTEHQSLAAYRTASAQDVIDATKIGDAPSDNKEYARKNGAWTEVVGGVQSVNGKTGTVTLDASDVGALPDSTVIPTALSELAEDSTHRLVTDTILQNITDNTTARHTHSNKSVLDGIDSQDIAKWDAALQKSDVVDNVATTTTDVPLSANQGKVLNDRIDNLSARGRFLSIWNSTTGLPITQPTSTPYTYKTGDYFVVGTVAGYTHTVAMSGTDEESETFNVSFSFRDDTSTAYSSIADLSDALQAQGHTGHSGTCPATGSATGEGGTWTIGYVASDAGSNILLQDSTTSARGTILDGATGINLTDTVSGSSINYKPDGATYTGTASSVVETLSVETNDTYLYDGTSWILQYNHLGGNVNDVQVNGTSIVSGGIANIANSSASSSGVMTPSQYTKLEGIEDGADVTDATNVASAGAEMTANRVSSWQATPDDTHYPTEKLVKDSLDAKATSSDITTAVTTHNVDSSAHSTLFSAKQDALVSGTNIKTINSNSILGSGDIATYTVTVM